MQDSVVIMTLARSARDVPAAMLPDQLVVPGPQSLQRIAELVVSQGAILNLPHA